MAHTSGRRTACAPSTRGWDPEREAARLAALRRLEILDTPPEADFQHIVELAALTMEAPAALISLVDAERQWIKAGVGLDVSETPRTVAFCDHTIRQGEVLVVPDAQADPRFAENPLVTGAPGIRFYAGAPLLTPEGHALGALCVIDFQPRAGFGAKEARRLSELAAATSDLLERRRGDRENRARVAAADTTAELLEKAELAVKFGTWAYDVEAGRLTWSAETNRIYGFEPGPGPLDVERVIAAYAEEDAPRVRASLERAIATGESYEATSRIRRPDGGTVHISTRGYARRDASGRVVALYGTIQDVTDLKLADSALRESEARYRTLAESVSDLFIQYDRAGVVDYVSQAIRRLGHEPEALIGLAPDEVRDLIGLDDGPAMEAVRAGRDPAANECLVRSRDGRQVWLEGSPAAIRDAHGRWAGLVNVYRDVTERRRMEEELRQKRAEAEAAVGVKAQFLANMSHELRTPLNGVIGFARLLAETPDLPPAAQEHAARVIFGGETLLALVNDILEFSRLEDGRVRLDPTPTDVRALLEDAVGLARVDAAAKGLSVRFEVGGSVPERVRVDGPRLRQVLLNLVGNAIKFTAAGEVAVRVSCAASGRGKLRVEVSDTGPGISPENCGRLFKRFSQVDGSNAREHGGAGLGLAISKGLVEAMGGKIGVDSALGRGSTFWFTADAPPERAPAPDAQRAAPPAPPAELAPVRVLVVDDLAVNRQLIAALLADFDVELVEAGGGAQAVELAGQRPFDIILMDVQMPAMDGLAATRAIRGRSALNAQTPILAVTANVLPAQIEACREAGMNDHVAKPIDAADLLAKIAAWTEAAAENPDAPGDYHVAA